MLIQFDVLSVVRHACHNMQNLGDDENVKNVSFQKAFQSKT